MKEYFISEIDIRKLYHLSNIKIELNPVKRQHLLITGKNGSGKTSLLLKIEEFLKALNDGNSEYGDEIKVILNNCDDIESVYQKGEFITAYFPAERKAHFILPDYNGIVI